MDQSKIEHLLKEDEGYKLDFKYKLSLEVDSEKKEFVKDVIAIANTPGGRGYILFGIRDKTKEIVGIDSLPENTEERIQQIIAHRSMPPVPVSFECIQMAGKRVGVLSIFKSRQIPHQMRQNGAFYVRRGSTTDVATRYEIAMMLQNSGLLSFERVPCPQASLEDLDLTLMSHYFEKGDEGWKFNLQLLVALGILEDTEKGRDFYPTYGGLLLLGKHPEVYMPQACIEVVSADEVWMITGNIMQMMETFGKVIRKIITEDYPYEALEEVVANAIIHRDYWNTFYYTHVSITSDWICVENPSYYPFKRQDNRHVRNNAWLYSRLLLIKQSNRAMRLGIGIDKVKKLVASKGEVRIERDQDTGLFTVCLPR